MAENKKSFVLYSDLKHVLQKLPDETAGKLFKLILAYVNDENPVVDDLLLDVLFEPIKQQFKRDLVKWESMREKRSQAGTISANKRKQNVTQSTHVEFVEQIPTNSTVNGTVNVTVSDILLKKETKYNFRNELIKYGFDSELVDEWLMVRKAKKSVNTKTAFNSFIFEVKKGNPNVDFNEILKLCVQNSWAGFKNEWITNQKTNINGKSTNTQESREQAIREFGK